MEQSGSWIPCVACVYHPLVLTPLLSLDGFTRAAEQADTLEVEASEESVEIPQPLDDPGFVKEEITYMAGKSFFDMREYDRAYDRLAHCSSHQAIFVALYAKYLVRPCRRSG